MNRPPLPPFTAEVAGTSAVATRKQKYDGKPAWDCSSGLVRTAHRGRLRMDGGQLLDDDYFRNHQAVAGFRQDRQSSISRSGMTSSSGSVHLGAQCL